MITQEEINKASQEYADSLALPQWDNKDIHAIDFQNGVAWALAQMASQKREWIDKVWKWIASNGNGSIHTQDEFRQSLEKML